MKYQGTKPRTQFNDEGLKLRTRRKDVREDYDNDDCVENLSDNFLEDELPIHRSDENRS